MQASSNSTFFQSEVFGKFQEKIPYRGKSWKIILPSGSAACLAVKMRLPFGLSWIWVPYGPPGAPASSAMPTGRQAGRELEIFKKIGEIAKRERSVFARIEPISDVLRPDGARNVTKRFTPEHTLLLDLEKSEDEILAQMKPKGRYNIQVAKRHGVRVRMYPNFLQVPARDFDAFYEILRHTSERDAFGIHPKYFYEKLLETFGSHHMGVLFLAYDQKDQVIAGTITVFYKDTATYYYGAFDYAHRNLMAPYLLQWEAMREAKKRGLKFYDFLGIAPTDSGPHGEKNHPWAVTPTHEWAGVTEFKKKFGGREVSYPPAFDIVYRPVLYWLLSLRGL